MSDRRTVSTTDPDATAGHSAGKTAGRVGADASARGLARRVAVGAGTTFAAKIVNTGLKFVTQIVLCRILGAAGFGLYALAVVVYQVGELVSGMGLEAGAVRFISIAFADKDADRLKGVLRHAVVIPLVAGAILGVAVFLSAETIAVEFFEKPAVALPLKIVALAMPFGAMMTVAAFATTGFGVTHYLAVVWSAHPATNLLLASGLCLMGFGVAGAAAAWAASAVVAGLLAAHFLRIASQRITAGAAAPSFPLRRLLGFSIPLALGNFLWLVMLWTDILLLGHFRPAEEVGIYRATSQTSLLPGLIIVSFNTIFAPTIASLLDRRELDKTRHLFQTATRWALSATLPVFLVLVVSGQSVLRIFGTGYEEGAAALAMLAAGQLVAAGTGSCGQILAMAGRQNLKLAGDFAMAVGNVLLNIALIPRYGMFGAAAATAASVTAVHLLRLVQVRCVLGLQPYNTRYVKVIVAAGAAGLAAMGMQRLTGHTHYLITIGLVAATTVLAYALLLAVFGLEDEDQQVWRDVRAKFEATPDKIGEQ